MGLTPAEIDAIEVTPPGTPQASRQVKLLSPAEIDAIKPTPELPRIEPPKNLAAVIPASVPIRLNPEMTKAKAVVMPKPEKSEIDAVQSRADELLSASRAPYENQSDIGPVTPPISQRALIGKEERAKRVRNEALHRLTSDYLNLADADEGFIQGLVKTGSGEGGAAKNIPFVGGLVSADAKALRNSLLEKMSRKEPLSEMEQQTIKAMALAQRRASMDTPFFEKVAEITGTSLPYAIEFGLTGGVYGAARGAVERVLPAGVSAAARYIAPRAVGVAAQTAVGSVPRTAAAFMDRMAQTWSVNPGSLEAVISDHQADKSTITELAKAGLDSYIENLSERTGGYLGSALGKIPKEPLIKLFRLGAIKQWMARHPSESFETAAKAIKDKLAFHGVAPEIFEEYVGDGLRSLTTVNDTDVYGKLAKDDLPGAIGEFIKGLPIEETPAMAVSFGLVPMAEKAGSQLVGGAQKLVQTARELPQKRAIAADTATPEASAAARRSKFTQLTPEQIDAIPVTGGPNADNQQSSVAQARPTQTQGVPPDASGASRPVQKPAGAGKAKAPGVTPVQEVKQPERRGGQNTVDVMERGRPVQIDSDEAVAQLSANERSAINPDGTVTIHRAVRKGATMQPGDFVVLDKDHAGTYATEPGMEIITQTVPAKDVVYVFDAKGPWAIRYAPGGALSTRQAEAHAVAKEIGATFRPVSAVSMEGIPPEYAAELEKAHRANGWEFTPQDGPAKGQTFYVPIGSTRDEILKRYQEQLDKNPTDAQKAAGNYKKEHIKFQGLDIAIENKAGSVRSGKDKGGNEWSVTMPADYGYIKRTEAKDGDQLDVYVGPNPNAQKVFIIDQIDPETGKFDEHKSFVGFDSVDAVIIAYDKAFSDGSGARRRGRISVKSVDEFKEWVKTGDLTKPLLYKPEGGAKPNGKDQEKGKKEDVLNKPADGGKPPSAPSPKPSGSSIRKPGTKAPESGTKAPESGTKAPESGTKPATADKPIDTISKGDWIEYEDSYGKTHQGKVSNVIKVGRITPYGAEKPRIEYMVEDASGKAMVSPKEGSPVKKIDPPESDKTAIIIARDRVLETQSVKNALANSTETAAKAEIAVQLSKVLGAMASEMISKPGVDSIGRTWVESYNAATDSKDRESFVRSIYSYGKRNKPAADSPQAKERALIYAGWVASTTGKSWAVPRSSITFGSLDEAYAALTSIPVPDVESRATTDKEHKAGKLAFIAFASSSEPSFLAVDVTAINETDARKYVIDDFRAKWLARKERNKATEEKPVEPQATKPTGKKATDANLKEMSDDEFDALLDEASKPKKKPEPPIKVTKAGPGVTAIIITPANMPKPKGSSLRKPSEKTSKPPAESAKNAAKAMKDALDEAAKGLDELFGGGTHMGSGMPSFDEETYRKAKPHFDAAWAKSKEAGAEIIDFLRSIVERWGEKAIPYLKRWRKDLTESESSNEPMDKRSGSPKDVNPEPSGGEGGAPGTASGGRVGGKQPKTGESVGGGRKPSESGAGSQPTGGTGGGASGGGRGDTSSATRDQRGLRGAKQPAGENYVITDADELGKGTPKAKAQGNLEAIRLVRLLESEHRNPTAEEKERLVKYVGWGGIKGIFVEDNKDFAREREELKKLLTPEEYAAARASIQDAHYTSQTVIVRGLYAALRRFGFTGGKMVEGGVGIGNMIGLMPSDWRSASSYIGIERDPLTAAIAQYLYPKARIWHKGYQEMNLARDHFDGAVGNPPFGNKAIYDKHFEESSQYTIHNYFIGKTLELTRPGGVVAQVVSRYFLDNAEPAAREHIASLGEFLGAIRLPNTAFKENAGTEVVTDLVFFKRVPKGTETNTDWTKVVSYKDPKSGLTWKVNKWIVEHPEMILGELTQAKHGLYSKDDMSVEPREGQDLGADLDAAVERLPANVYEVNTIPTKERLTTNVEIPEGVKNGGYFVSKGKLFRRLPDLNGERQSADVEMKAGTVERVKAIIPIRDALNRLIKAELQADAAEAAIEAERKALNKAYDAFTKKFGFLNSSTNRRAFYEDSDSMRVLGLERDYSAGISKETAKKKGVDAIPASARKADIFTKRVNVPYREVTSVDTPKEALMVSLNQRGRVDVDYMAQLLGKDRAAALQGLEGLIFQTPAGDYESREQYLSGNVREKLKQAQEAGAGFEKNVEALTAVIPKDIEATEIIAPIGAPWVAANDVAAFATELTGSAPSSILFQKANAGWLFEHHDRSNASTQKWGTPRMPFGELFKTLLNGKAVVVYDLIDDENGGEKRIVNQQETELANAKASEVRDKWQEWIWSERERRERLHRIYNDSYNNYVDFKADGSHLTLPGASPLITLNPHQKNVVWRTITTGGEGLLYDQVVGSGKTFAGVASMMELKRLGRVRKWLVPVPNHLTGQWADAFNILYPNANILAAKPSDFTKENRQKLFSKILTGDYDAVILGHSSLKKIGTAPEVEKGILEEMLAEIVSTIEEMREAERGRQRGSRAVAQMERTKDNIEAKIARLSNIGGRDTVAMFEELGFDGMMVDEAHEFKNLFYTTQMQNVSGLGNPAGSAKAFDLYLKTRYLRKQYGGKAPIVFLTGTPISNSLVEMFTMQRYLQPQILEDMGLKTLDAWARVFADVRPVYEVDPTGTGYRMATRLANFQNVGELTAIYRNMADVVTMNDLQAQAEAAGKRFPVPKIKGGKPNNFVSERTPEQAEYFGIETQQLDDQGKPMVDGEGVPITSYPQGTILWRVDNMPDDPREDNMLKLTNDARKAGLDMRLIDPNAPDRPQSKINRAVENIVRIHKDTAADKGTQLVFCDLSVPSSARGKATKEAKSSSLGFYIAVNGELVPVEASPVELKAAPQHQFFVRKSAQGRWLVSEKTSGLSVGVSAKTKAEAVELAEGRISSMEAGQFDERVKAGQPTPEMLASLAEKAQTAEKPEAEVSDESDDTGGEQGVSVDELLADQSSLSVYDDMKAKLIKAGIPEKEIAFIHDYNTPEKKMKLFAAVNAGEVRILFGSTAKMGAGTNVQRLAVALHHMDAPWRPSDLEQREGRVIRQGNYFYTKWMFPDWDGVSSDYGKPRYASPQDYDKDPAAFAIEVNRYATALTYDTRMWQIIEHKAAGIEGFRKADRSTRRIEDIAGEAANAADMKAAASGDPLIQQEMQLRNELNKLQLLKKAWDRNRIELQNRMFYLEAYEARYKSKMDEYLKREETLKANTPVDKDGKPVFEFRFMADHIRAAQLAGVLEGKTPEEQAAIIKAGAVTDEKGIPVQLIVDMIKAGHTSATLGKYRGFTFGYQTFSKAKMVLVDAEKGQFETKKVPGIAIIEGERRNIVTEFTEDDKLTGVGLFQRLDNYLEPSKMTAAFAESARESEKKQLEEVKSEIAKPFSKEELLSKTRTEHETARTQLMNKKRSKAAPQQGQPLEGWDQVASGDIYRDSTHDALLQKPVLADVVLDALNATSAFEVGLIEKLKSLGLKTTVRLAAQEEAARRGHPTASGLYLPDTDEVLIFGASVNQHYAILHELVHAATVKAILDNPKFRADLEALLAEAKANPALSSEYGLKNVQEFVAEAFSNQTFQKRLAAIGKTQTLWQKFLGLLRRLFGISADDGNLLERLIRRSVPEFKAGASNAEPAFAENAPVTAREAAIAQGVEEQWVPTQVMGEIDHVRGRERITPLSTAESLTHARNIFNEAGVDVVRDQSVGGWRISSREADDSAAGRRLVEILKREIQTKNSPGKAGDLLASLLNSVVLNFKAGTMNFDQPTREALYNLAQSDRSQRGLALGALAGFREDQTFVAQNVDVVLSRVYADAFGGNGLGSLMERVIKNFRSFFTDAEIEDALKTKAGSEELINRMIALNRRDEGGRVYRKIQGLLKPKRAKTLGALEADARVEEAVQAILAEAAKQGIEPKPSPNKPLSAVRRLALLVSDKNAARIDLLVANAVAQAERNAGIAATLAAAESEEERADLEARFAEGEEPEAEMIEEGLDMPVYAHWREIRENFLGYSPVTVKLVQEVIDGTFKGTSRAARKTLANTKIDLNALAIEPEAEVRRVLDAFYANIEANVDYAEASPETTQRIVAMVEADLTRQLEAARKRARDPMFNAPPSPGSKLTDEQRVAQKMNAGIFRDERLDIPEMVTRIAAKSLMQRLTPGIPELVKRVFETPFYRQSDLAAEFAASLIRSFGVSDEQAEKARTVFEAAFEQKFARARENAQRQAREAITPQEAAQIGIGMKKSVWKRVEQAVNSGIFDTGSILREVAQAHDWKLPTDADVAQMKAWAEEEQRLRELTPAERAAIGEDPARLTRAQGDKEAATMERRVQIKKKIEVEWAKMTRPISFTYENWWANRRNFAAAGNELASANLLLKLGFAPRQVLSVLTQGAIHTPTRAVAHAIEAHLLDRQRGRQSDLWQGVQVALKDAYRARFASVKTALYATRAAFMGRGEARNVDRLMSSIAAVERISREADIQEAKGNNGAASVLRLFSLIRLGYRVAQALDNIHGVPAEYQEMIHQVERGMRELGKSRLEIETAKDRVLGNMQADWIHAIAVTRSIYDANGLEPKPGELQEAAWGLVKRWQYDRIQELTLPADDFEESNRLLRSTIGWNERETKGLGGMVGRAISGVSQLGESVGIPLAVGRFGNAIAISINRQLSFTPFYFMADVGAGESGWTKTDTDRRQRKIEAAVGTIAGAAVLALAWAGAIIVRASWPRDKEERDLWEAHGIRPGTVEFHLGDGRFIPISINNSPLQPLAPYLAAGGALYDLTVKREKAQAKLDATAARTGVPAGQLPALGLADILAVAATAAHGSIMGGRTAAGLISSMTDYGTPNAQKFMASQIAPLVPGLPAMQEVSRMAGVNLDSRLATFWDFLLPLPTSGAVKVNLLGEPARTPDDLQRIAQVLTGGSYPGVVDADASKQRAAYETLFASGYRPPSIDPNRGYLIGNEVRPMTAAETATYTAKRGEYFKDELEQLGPTSDPKEVRAAYQRANVRALADVGVTAPVRSKTVAAVKPTAMPKLTTVARTPSRSVGTLRFAKPRARRVAATRISRGPSLRLRKGGLKFTKPKGGTLRLKAGLRRLR